MMRWVLDTGGHLRALLALWDVTCSRRWCFQLLVMSARTWAESMWMRPVTSVKAKRCSRVRVGSACPWGRGLASGGSGRCAVPRSRRRGASQEYGGNEHGDASGGDGQAASLVCNVRFLGSEAVSGSELLNGDAERNARRRQHDRGRRLRLSAEVKLLRLAPGTGKRGRRRGAGTRRCWRSRKPGGEADRR